MPSGLVTKRRLEIIHSIFGSSIEQCIKVMQTIAGSNEEGVVYRVSSRRRRILRKFYDRRTSMEAALYKKDVRYRLCGVV